MDLLELKKEQLRLAPKVKLNDGFSTVKTIGGVECLNFGNKLLACVVVCEFPSLKIKEKKTYVLDNPLPYKPGFAAYRELPAIIEAYNQLDEEPDILLVSGPGILHPKSLGTASHAGLALNKSAIGVQDRLGMGNVKNGKILVDGQVMGFEIKTREFSKPIFVSPGHLISLGSVLDIICKIVVFPHKMPEPLYLAHKIGKKITRKLNKKEED